MHVMDILSAIERGEITVQDGISHIKESRSTRNLPSGRGRFMKVKVLDKDQNFSFTIPIFLIGMGLSAARFGASVSKNGKVDDKASKALDVIGSLDKKDIKMLVDELRMCKGLNFIEVYGKGEHVSIRIV